MKLFVLLVCVGVAVAHTPYIIGGNNVTVPGKWPHQGSVRVEGIGYFCGISLISPTWGVTSAEYMVDVPVDEVTLQFGSNDRTKGGQVVNAKQIIMHEDFDDFTHENDIAVIEFTEAVTAEYAAPIPLADGSTDPAGNPDCWVTGWGITNLTTLKYPEILQEAKINVYTNDECKKDWPSYIYPGNVCIGDTVHKRTTCFGDTGGPLVCRLNGRYELVGAESWGFFSCLVPYPSVYSRISYFREWIKGKTGI